ncbi:hypothetical protein GGQ74_001450 [Desulfobaculum xiamenense]|uniref:Uncharacterized protein n=1 Tax=Desulfobaculum xiamenense TaxID=995050 RepID=A0A846QL83_9BACT|nr:hypothetical protein [Desulfobaculum xiamenense]NJB67810.1 hypothetical protein [Desulfobaculum xiamenense]
MIDFERFTETVVIDGEEYRYDPVSGMALVQCGNCSNMEEVECEVVEGKGRICSFMCTQCGHFNEA